MLYKRKQLPEIWFIRHKNDSEKPYVTYEDKLLTSTLSSYIFNNPIMSGFLEKLQLLLSLMFDKMNIVKNFKNYIVDKYER